MAIGNELFTMMKGWVDFLISFSVSGLVRLRRTSPTLCVRGQNSFECFQWLISSFFLSVFTCVHPVRNFCGFIINSISYNFSLTHHIISNGVHLWLIFFSVFSGKILLCFLCYLCGKSFRVNSCLLVSIRGLY